jgi:putative chitinase
MEEFVMSMSLSPSGTPSVPVDALGLAPAQQRLAVGADQVQQLAGSGTRAGDADTLRKFLGDHPEQKASLQDAAFNARNYSLFHQLSQPDSTQAQPVQLAAQQTPGAAAAPAAQAMTPAAGGPAAATIAQPGRPHSQVTTLTADQLRTIMPNSGAQADAFVGPLNREMAEHGITRPEQRAAFLGQASVETGNLRHMEENDDYSAKRLHEVWPSRFPTIASAQPYAHNPVAMADHVYANRNGNGNEASGDGYNFHGRGLIQLTGRGNYQSVGYDNDPDALLQPHGASDSAARFWENNDLNTRTQSELKRGRFDDVSRTVNGGENGLDERWDAYQRALGVLRPQP